jgi:hypothetical protein
VSGQDSVVRRPPLHAVHLYSSDTALIQYVVSQLAEPLLEAQPVLVCATAPHRRHLVDALTDGGLDVGRLRDSGLYGELDAHEVMHAVLVDGGCDGDRFHEQLGSRIRAAAGRYGGVHLYGEVMALLWAGGSVVAALELERCWNELAREVPFRLCCGYPTSVIGAGDSADAVEQMFREHTELALA